MSPRPHARKRASAPHHARTAIHASPVFAVTLGLLFLIPVFFTPGWLVDEYEFPKVSLLVAGALVLAAWWIAAESSRVASAGFPGWLRHLPGRAAGAMRRDPLGAAVALFLLSAVASTLASVRPGQSLFGAQQSNAGLRTFVALAAIYYASRSLAGKATWIHRIAQAAVVAGGFAAVIGFLQSIGFDPLRLTWIREAAPANGASRAWSTLGSGEKLCAYLAMCLPLAVWLGVRARSRSKRIAWLALAVLLLAGIWAGLHPSAYLRFSESPSKIRAELSRVGIRMAQDHPAFGVGVDAFAAAFPKYRTPELTRMQWGGTPSKAQNDAIQILATQGFLGALLGLAVVLLTLRALARIALRGPETRGAAIAATGALLGYVVPNLTGSGSAATSALAAALAGWAARASLPVDEAPGTDASVRSFWNLGAGVAIAGVLAFFLLWNPLLAELYLVRAMRAEAASLERDESLAHAAAVSPWDARYPAELGRSIFNGALRQRDAQTAWEELVRARTALEQAVRIAPENGENRTLLASVMSAQAAFRPGPESNEEVRREFQRAVDLDPMNPEVLVAAERGLLAVGMTGEAHRIALRCAQLYPNFPSVLADLGAIALEQGRMADAADTLELALKWKWREDPIAEANVWNDLATARLALGRYKEAADAAGSALGINPRLGQAFANREAAHRGMGKKLPGEGKPATPK